jgi:pimeloyl-ACP methyl ester carboxylesterase
MRIIGILVAILVLVLAFGWAAGRLIGARMQALYPPIGNMMLAAGRKVHVYDNAVAAPAHTVLMIHGASGNLREMVFAFGKRLSPDIRLLAIDRPGQGYTERLGLEADASLDAQAAMAIAVLDAKGIRKAVILAHSLGGALALRLALDHPDRVEALVLFAPVTHPWPGGVTWYYDFTRLPVIGKVFAHAIAPAAGYLTVDAAIDGIFLPARPPEGYRDAIGAGLLLRPDAFEANAHDVAALLPQVAAQAGRYGELAMPVLVMTADVDTVVSPEIHSRTFAREAPRAKLIIVPGAGHAPHQTKPDIVMPAVDAFLRALPPP